MQALGAIRFITLSGPCSQAKKRCGWRAADPALTLAKHRSRNIARCFGKFNNRSRILERRSRQRATNLRIPFLNRPRAIPANFVGRINDLYIIEVKDQQVLQIWSFKGWLSRPLD